MVASANAAPYFYLFVSDHRPDANSDIPILTDSTFDTVYDPWRQMIFGKRVRDFSAAIVNSPYTSGTVYPAWDDQVDMSLDDPWYAVVNAGSYSHVFGCLYNANGIPSTVEPDFAQVSGSNTILYQTSDGYRWKYMYSVDSDDVSKFATDEWFPYKANTEVEDAAVAGSIDVVHIEYGGKGYDNYLTGTLQASDIRVNSVVTLYQVSNTQISTANGFYDGCMMILTSGPGAGQFSRVHSFYSTVSGNFVELEDPFVVSPVHGSGYALRPSVRLESDGQETIECQAIALVNSVAANSIWTVQVLDPGAGYFAPTTAYVYAANVVGVTQEANVRPIMPPKGGHGYDGAVELGAKTLIASVTLSNTEGGTIPATNSYRSVGLLRGPLFSETYLNLSSPSGLFLSPEPASVMTLSTRAVNCSINVDSGVVTSPTALFGFSLQANATVFLSNGTVSMLANIASVTNSSVLTLDANSEFTMANAVLYAPTFVANATVSDSVLESNIAISSVTAPITTGQIVYGHSSRNRGTITAITRGGVVKDFDTYIQLTKYDVSIMGGSFIEDETVAQGTRTGIVHSYANGSVFISNMTMSFDTESNFIGQTSGCIASPSRAYAPELLRGTGTIEYVEAIDPVTRQANQNEQWIVAYQY